MTDPQVPSATQIKLRTIWAALTIGCVTYILLARMLRPAAVPAASMFPDPARPIELALAAAAVAVVVAGIVVSRLMMQSARDRLRAAAGSEEDVERALVAPLIIRYAMFEAASLLGFALVLTGAPAAKVIPFVALSVLALILNFPSRDRIVRELSG